MTFSYPHTHINNALEHGIKLNIQSYPIDVCVITSFILSIVSIMHVCMYICMYDKVGTRVIKIVCHGHKCNILYLWWKVIICFRQ